MQQQIYQKDNITLFASNQEKRLKLRVVETISQEKSHIYEAVLNSLTDGQKLSENFESFQQVIDQIKDNPDGVEIDLKKPAIIIHAQVVGKKAKLITLGVIQLQQKQIIVKQLEEVLLLKVIEVCNSKTELNSDLTKQLIQNMSIGLKILLQQRKQAKEWRINMETRLKLLQEENKQLLSKLSDAQNLKQEQSESEKQEDIELIEKTLLQKFQQQWETFIKKQNKQLQKTQKIKKVFQICNNISAEKLIAQYERYDKKVRMMLPITPQNIDKYIDLLAKYKLKISSLSCFGLMPFTGRSKINLQISIQSDFMEIQPLLIQSTNQTLNILSKRKPDKQFMKQIIIKQTKTIKQKGKQIFQKIYKTVNYTTQISEIMQILNNAIYDFVRPSNNNNNEISYNYFEFTSAISTLIYQQELKHQIQEFGKVFTSFVEQVKPIICQKEGKSENRIRI